MIILLFHCDVACCLQKAEMGFPALPNTRTINDTTGMMSGALDSLSYGDGSKPWYLVNPKIAGKWMFIPLKMYL